MGEGSCLDAAEKRPRHYGKSKAFSRISGCRDLCTTLSAACVGYYFAASGDHAGLCVVYGNALPDKGTGAAAPGKLLDGWDFNADGGNDTLTRADERKGGTCHAKQLGASGTHVPMPRHRTPNVL